MKIIDGDMIRNVLAYVLALIFFQIIILIVVCNIYFLVLVVEWLFY